MPRANPLFFSKSQTSEAASQNDAKPIIRYDHAQLIAIRDGMIATGNMQAPNIDIPKEVAKNRPKLT